MADTKISALTAATTPLAGTEVLPIVQSGVTKQVAVSDLTAGRAVSALSVTTTADSTINGKTVGTGASNLATNTVFGDGALTSNTTGNRNTALGSLTLAANTTGLRNTAVGRAALTSNQGGSYNAAYGQESLNTNVSGNYNAAYGISSLRNATGSNNAAFGYQALYDCTGSNVTAIGYNAGNTATTGSNNGFFGYNAQPSAVGVSNEYTYGDANVTVHRFYGNLTPLGAAKGVNFTANSATAGMTSQLLNWYEEGTWTPSLGGDATYTVQTGTYVRVGKLVFVKGTVTVNVRGTGSNNTLSGLPFSSATNSDAISVSSFSGLNQNVTYLIFSSSGSTLVATGTQANTSSTGTRAIFADGTSVSFSGCYRTS